MKKSKSFFKPKYPIEYIEAQLEFGLAVHKNTELNVFESFCNYTDLYGTLSNNMYINSGPAWVKEVLSKLDTYLTLYKDDYNELLNRIWKLYLSIPLDEYNVFSPEKYKFGCFKLNTSDFYLNRGEVRVHFTPLKLGLESADAKFRVSDLSSAFMPMRNHEFSEMVNYIYNNPDEFQGVERIFSCTWLQNIPSYANLFTENAVRSPKKTEFYWFWTQFIKWDGTGNSHRLKELRENLATATTLDQVIDSIPQPVLETRVELKDLFKMYVSEYVDQEAYSDVSPVCDTNPLLLQEPDYLLAV